MKLIIKEVCKNKVSVAKTTEHPKTGAKVMTYTTTRKCSQDIEAIQEEDEDTPVETAEDKEKKDLLAEPVGEETREQENVMEGIKKTFSRFL